MAHALLRTTLSRYAPVEPAAWTFGINSNGRPDVEIPSGCPPLRASLSHTAGLAACAVTLARDLGVDVEDCERRANTLEVADSFFSPAEARELRALPISRQLEPDALDA